MVAHRTAPPSEPANSWFLGPSAIRPFREGRVARCIAAIIVVVIATTKWNTCIYDISRVYVHDEPSSYATA